ncbi:Midasin [Lamellibrachia satsuma]|nr:Midasin [Lamellibrachia satsuma]
MTQQNQQSLDVSKPLEALCKKSEKCSSKLQAFLAKQIWTPNDREALLDQLSVLLVQPDCTLDVAHAFCSLQLDLLHRAERQVFQNGHIQFVKHQKFCVALSKTVALSSESKRFSVKYLQNVPAFFTDQETDQPSAKKPRKSRDKSKPKAKDLVQAVHRFLQHMCSDLRELWDWSDFLAFLQSGNAHTRWHAVHSVALLLDMAPARLSAFRRRHFTPQEERDLSIRYDEAVEKASGKALLLSNPAGGAWQVGEKRSHTMKGVVDTDLCEDIVAVCGVLIPKIATPVDLSVREAVLLLSVPSTRHNMHSVALAVASCHPVLLEGPVGCGKTALVEHLALLTGRGAAPHLMKVQLGDQTDSKALLGTYRCTDVPGQFEWQPGTLTQAVTDGHWILLEDLDYAPMDVISMLVPLLEGNTLSVPGHGDVIKAAPGFRLFATQRLMRSEFGWYKTHSSGSDILERMWTKICVEPLSRAELQQWTDFLDIYFLLSAGRHDTSDDMTQDVKSDADIGKFLTRDGRLISTRDLMKWCSRIARGFVASAPSTANMVYQEALDCFCASLAQTRHRLPLAEAIAARLNLTKATAEYYCQNYKPTLDLSPSTFTVGRVSLPRQTKLTAGVARRQTATSFAFTRQSVALLEQVAVCVAKNEPVLLVGETGTGKTSSVQFLSQQMGEKLRVINMNQQSDSADLLGGFKPVDLRFVVAPFREEFEMLFCETFSRKQNRRFLGHIQECFANRRWADLFKLMNHTQKAAVKKFAEENEQLKRWTNVGRRLRKLRLQVKQVESALAFTFVEGTLVRALRQGEWVLLDEINLASAETLECLSGLLESTTGSVVLMERGDTKPIVRHENFRLFACMNPATDVGKKELPLGVRNRFTEFFVDELEDSADLKILVREYLKGLSLSAPQIEGIVKFYLIVKAQAAKSLTDGTGHKPHYSLRTLCRALRQAAMNACESVPRSLYEGFCLAFLTQLDRSSHPIVEKLVCEHIVGKSNIKSLLKQPIPAPPGGKHVKFESYWVATGDVECVVPDGYVLTPLVRSNLRDLTRVVSAGRYPVLLQGETSVGKTSLITWLARASGNTCVRINNHEHTDLQEYIGCYAADDTGKLAFQEGVLVEAMRKGHWIILDELNLAPSDVLEALNRLLDDNRELFIPETQETVKAHPRFMLFATQNPPGQYAGRKILSRAFRNRFVELHFDEIPSSELETILHKRCSLPMSHCRRLVKIMLELQVRRRSSGVFAGKQGYITLRDLFRWAERYHLASQECTAKFFDWDQLLADNGYMLLAGRVRKPEECHVICEVIEKHLKRRVDPNCLFTLSDTTSPTTAPILNDVTITPPGGFEHVVWTYSLRRMAVLVGQALKFGEPVLLVGDTGCGKTTMCQLFAAVKKQRLYSVNCHLHTESADFLGGLRPVRHHDEVGVPALM